MFRRIRESTSNENSFHRARIRQQQRNCTMRFFLTLSFLLVISIESPLAGEQMPQTAEEMLESLRTQFKLAADLNNIKLENVSYDRHEATDLFGPNYVEMYDFIIVGAGSAGTVLANRLSEVPWYKILLIEAGDVADFMTDIPALAGLQQFGQYNWGNLAEVQHNMGLGLKNQRMLWSRGRGLGGTSLINYMIHVRGNRIDYDTWAAMGNPGWSYEEVLPYFKKSEDSRVKLEDAPYRHHGGELTVEDTAYRSASVHTFIEACLSLGYPYVDYNGAQQLGVSYIQATTRDGLRCNGEKAFLRPVRRRPNLTIRTNSLVVKVLINDRNEAYGIEYIRNAVRYTVRATREVILSAGPFNSPQLLMLSGVGPQGHLAQLGIPIKKDLPVGQKLYDHLMFLGISYRVNADIGINTTAFSDPASFVELLKLASGPLTSLGGVEGIAYMKSHVSSHPLPNYPDLELLFFGVGVSWDNGVAFARFFQVADEVYNVMFRPLEGQPVVMVLPVLLHPLSYGYLKLSSANPFDYPNLYGNYFTDPEGLDVRTFIAGIREVQRIFSTPAFQKFGAELVTTVMPGCEAYVFDSDTYWECALRSLSVSLYHQVSTCKMGPETDPEAVVDPRLRVYGIRNLRVIDTSIIPMLPSAHTNVPAYMIGEKGSDIIKQDW